MLSSLARAEGDVANTENGSLYPASVVVEYNNEQLDLSLSGSTIRKKFFLKIYSIAHYLEHRVDVPRDDIYQNILQHKGAKQISMKFMRALYAEQVKKSLISGIKLNTNNEQYLHIQPYVDQFMQAISEDVKRDDEFTIRWFADGTLVSIYQGQEISTIKSEEFAKTLWSIWFSKHSVVDRKTLVQQLQASS